MNLRKGKSLNVIQEEKNNLKSALCMALNKLCEMHLQKAFYTIIIFSVNEEKKLVKKLSLQLQRSIHHNRQSLLQE